MGHHHGHDHPTLSGKNLLISIILNSVITLAQLIGGLISGSLALISDAVHNFSDVVSLIISYLANLLVRKKKQTPQHTFGYKRAEIIAAFINASTLVIIAIVLGYEAVKRFTNPQTINSDLVIWLAILGIAVNGFSVLLLKKDAKSNLNMKTAYLHLLTDMLTSVAVLVGGLLMKYYQIYWIDALLTLLISFYLIYISWNILITSLKILMLFAPEDIKINDVENEILKIEEVKNIHHVHIWQLNDHDSHFEAHIEFKKDVKLSSFDVVCEKVEEILAEKFHIFHSTLQPEYKRDDSKEIIKQD
ncbi:MAG: cation transporter [Lutibacter sp.]|uniref:cation diffusion facilitator family transporter n=1 Tax=Lutibacter sp. TaxID=1925666 RepID=UPI0017DFEBFC|nr:cation diffusion facilitator family transporter [Lutibacter sp.]MBT8317675.1 cation diffusion facilitator family transporter [Lutibacter sp.]NNJ58533.1 cation transporter [Lutibacter sp.]